MTLAVVPIVSVVVLFSPSSSSFLADSTSFPRPVVGVALAPPPVRVLAAPLGGRRRGSGARRGRSRRSRSGRRGRSSLRESSRRLRLFCRRASSPRAATGSCRRGGSATCPVAGCRRAARPAVIDVYGCLRAANGFCRRAASGSGPGALWASPCWVAVLYYRRGGFDHGRRTWLV